MHPKAKDPILEIMENAVRDGVSAALKRHRFLGETVAVWRDGRVQTVLVDELDLDEDGYPRGQNPSMRGTGPTATATSTEPPGAISACAANCVSLVVQSILVVHPMTLTKHIAAK